MEITQVTFTCFCYTLFSVLLIVHYFYANAIGVILGKPLIAPDNEDNIVVINHIDDDDMNHIEYEDVNLVSYLLKYFNNYKNQNNNLKYSNIVITYDCECCKLCLFFNVFTRNPN